MRFPINIHFGNFEIDSHLICELLSYTIGYRYYLFLRKNIKDPISDENRLWIFVGAAAGGFFGSHILGILEHPEYFSSIGLIYFMGTKTILGGFLGGLAGVEITKKIIGVNTSSGDLMVYPLLLGLIIGRIGCFLAGVKDGTYGVTSDLPWAMNLGDGILRHPTNLYEILFLLLLWLLIRLAERTNMLLDGYRFKIFMVSYLIFRFFIEFIKPNNFYAFGLCTLQLSCLSGLLYYCILEINLYLKKSPKTD
jgi:prolipoprotein diacylglyceryltransferase